MTPTQLLGEILHQELVDQDVEKSLTLKMGKSLALKASSSEVVEEKPKPSKSKKVTLAMKKARMKKPPLP
jgi:hypothetical protein